MIAEWHYNAGWRLPLDDPRFQFIAKSETPEIAIGHLRIASRAFPFEWRYRTGYALGLVQQAIFHLSQDRGRARPFVMEAIDELARIAAIDHGDARVMGHLISFRIELGLPVDGMMDRFVGIARNGPSVKVAPAPSDGTAGSQP